MISNKQFAFITLIAIFFAGSGAVSGLAGGTTGVVAGALGGTMAGGLIGYVLVAIYNSRTEDEVLTVEDVQ